MQGNGRPARGGPEKPLAYNPRFAKAWDSTRAMRVLLVKTSSLGDVIHNLPVASDLARQYPGIVIDWVVEASFADIPALHPAVSAVHTVALRRWKKTPFAKETRSAIRAFKAALSAIPYDLVLDTQGLMKSAWITRQARGPKAGYDRRSIREPLASFAYDRRYAVDRALHAVDRNRRLAAAAFGYALESLPLDYGLHNFQKNGANAAPGIEAILLTATSRDDKLWAEDHWTELGRTLAQRSLSCVLPSGSPVERERAERIAATIPGAIALPPTSIRELAGRLAKARCAVGVDTGLTHLACATGIPTVALYTATDPGLTGTVGTNYYRNLGGKDASPPVADVLAALGEASVI